MCQKKRSIIVTKDIDSNTAKCILVIRALLYFCYSNQLSLMLIQVIKAYKYWQ